MFESFVPGFLVQTLLVGILTGVALRFFLKLRRYNMPPGPWGLPFIGNAFQLGPDKRYHIQFYEWSKRYGPVITVGLGPIKVVVVNNIELAMEVLVKKSTEFAGRYQWTSIGRMTDGFKDIAFSKYGPTWKLHRKISSKALRYYMQGEALEKRIHTALETTFTVLDEKSEPFDPEDVINFLISNITLGLCFNGQYEYGNKEIQEIVRQKAEFNHAYDDLIAEDMLPFLQYVYTSKPMKIVEKTHKLIIEDFMAKKFKEAKKTFDRDNIRHLADTLMLSREEVEAEEEETLEQLTDEHLIQTLDDIFLGGLDTSRLVIQFAILHMIAFPDIQRKVQEELDREIGQDRLPGSEDRTNLGYTEAVLHESMRLATISPSGVFHCTLTDTELAGYKLPKDTFVMINHWALHHEPDAWDEVDKFKPERFLDDNGKLGPKPPNWLPFSAGKRVCLGEFVAKPALHLLFAGLMQTFSWTCEKDMDVDITPGGSLFVGEPTPYKVIVRRRKC